MRSSSLSADGQEGNRGGNAKPYRQNARPHTGRHKQMPAPLDDVACGKTLTESRRHNRPAEQRNPHLAAMRMTGQSERNAVGN